MKKIGNFLCVFFLLIPMAQAQLVLPKALEKPIEKALARNRTIQNKVIEVEKTEIDRKSILSKYIPRLEAMAGYAYFSNTLTVDIPGIELPISEAELFEGKTKFNNHGQFFHGGLLVKSVLFSGMQIQNGAKALKEKAKGDKLLIETVRDELILAVITSFDKIKYLQASSALIRESERRLQKETERVNKAIDNGLAVPFDRDKIKLAQLELEAKQIELANAQDLLIQKITYLTGMSTDEIEQVLYKLEPLVIPEGLSIKNKQELEALTAYRRAKKYMLKKEKGSYWPQVAAFAGVSYTSVFDGEAHLRNSALPTSPQLGLNELTLAPNWIIGIGLKWTIFGGTERKNNVKKAQLELEQLDLKLADSREQLQLLLHQKSANYISAWKQVELANQRLEVAQNNLTQAQKQYRHGLISVNQRLVAESDLVKAGRERVKILIEQRESALQAIKVSGHLSQKIQYQ